MNSTFKIVVGYSPADSKVELNGVPIEGVVRVSFDLNANRRDPSMLRLEIIGEALVEGQFVDRVIASTELQTDDTTTRQLEAPRGFEVTTPGGNENV